MLRFILGLFGLLLPASFTAPKMLETELIQYGIQPGRLPKACLQEFVDEEITRAKADAKRWGGMWKDLLVTLLEGLAVLIAQVIRGNRGGDVNDHILAVLKKHGVPLQ
jgi:hypothetical protein